MKPIVTRLLAFTLLACPLVCFGDASYEHTSQITGGQFVNTLKSVSFISKQVKAITDPTSEITMVHGNQKAVVSKDYTEITDLDKEVIIRIDNNKKSYSVITFADMRKMVEEMPAKMAQMQQQMKEQQAKMQQQQQKNQAPALPPNLQFNFTTTVTDPGPSKVVNGQNAVQQIVTMKMGVTDTNNPATTITYSMTTEVWTTPDLPAEMKEVRDFDMRFGQKLMQGMDASALMASWAGMRNGSSVAMAQMFGSTPGAADAFAQMQKELAKIKGTRILEIQRMGGTGTGIADSSANGSATPPNGSSVAGQVANDTAKQTASGEASSHLGGSIPGSALGGALMNAWNRKKAKPAPPPPAQSATTTPATGTTGDVTLMEMTTQTHNFSTESIPMSIFQIPSNYKQVESPMAQAMSR
jgi:hypothetical protein